MLMNLTFGGKVFGGYSQYGLVIEESFVVVSNLFLPPVVA